MQVNQPQGGDAEATTARYETIVIRGAKGGVIPKEVAGGEVVAWSQGHGLAAMNALEEFVDELAAGGLTDPDSITRRAQRTKALMSRGRRIGWDAEGNTMNYDPNLTSSGNMASQCVRLIFGMWKYRAVLEVSVGGNCTGFDVIDCAVRKAYGSLQQLGVYGSDSTYAVINMTDPTAPDSILECSENDNEARLRGEEWLKDLLIAAEITSIIPNEPVGSL